MSDPRPAPWLPAGPALLFAPADRPDRFPKAAERSDVVILDLEDGCRPENKEQARREVQHADLDPERTIVRVNSASTAEFDNDVAALAGTAFRTVMLAKAEGGGDVDKLARALEGVRIIAHVETPLGVVNAREIAAADGTVAMFWGAEDLVAGLGGTSSRGADGAYRSIPAFARSWVRLAAAAHGKTALDAVYTDIADTDGLRAEADDAAALGFAGSCCIHPSQVEVIRAAYRPSDADLAWARGLLAEAEHNRGAFSYEGRMVDEPLFRQAQAIVARAGDPAA